MTGLRAAERSGRRLAVALAGAALLLPGLLSAWEFDVSGSLRQGVLAHGSVFSSDDTLPGGPALPGAGGVSETRLRPGLRAVTDLVALELAVEGLFVFATNDAAGREGASLLGNPAVLQPHDPLGWQHVDEADLQISSRVERLWGRFRLGPLDLDLGRQAVGFGASRFVGVLDVVTPFAPGALDATYRPGVDAVRLRAYPGARSEIEAIAAWAEPVTTGVLLVRGRLSFGRADLEWVGGRFRARNFGGLGWEVDTGPFLLWGEAGLFQRHEPHRAGWQRAAFTGVVGGDAMLPARMLAGLGLYYSDFGARRPAELLVVSRDRPFLEGWMFLRSAGYALITFGREWTPLTRSDLIGLINLADGSTLWQPRVSINVADNADLAAYAWIPTGARPELLAVGPVPVGVRTRSEFGLVPFGGGLYARWFF